jgi:hypothetical protein
VGEQVRKTIKTLAVDWSEFPESRNSVLMNLLEGDPSTIIFSPETEEARYHTQSKFNFLLSN